MLAVGVAKGGTDGVKPLLQDLYRTRASAYQQAVRSFVEGYREGLAEKPRESFLGTGTRFAGQVSDSKCSERVSSETRGDAASPELTK